MSPAKPGIVVVHGSWHQPMHFETVNTKLRGAGYQVQSPQNPSSAGPVIANALDEDVENIKKSIRHFTDAGSDVVMILHSYGGLCGHEAIAEWSEEEKSAPAGQTARGRILRTLCISSIILEKGTTIVSDNLKPFHADFADGLIYHLDPFQAFYHLTPPPVARKAIGLLRPQNMSAIRATRYAGWKDYDIPVDYIFCEQDRGLDPDADLTKFVKRLEQGGTLKKVHRLNSDHSPFLSAHDDFMAIVWGFLESNPNVASSAGT